MDLVNPAERTLFGVVVCFSVLVYVALIVSVVGIAYIVIGATIALFAQGLFVGRLRGNAIRVSERQYSEVHGIAVDLSRQMQIPVPDIYLVQEGGALNAFATRFLGRDFVVILSDLMEVAYEEGEEAIRFVIAHELAHLERKHVARRWLIYPGLLMPFLGSAYLRACEYTCDRYGARYAPDGGPSGLLILAAGKRLYRRLDRDAYSTQVAESGGFWVWLSEMLSTHPNLPKRVAALSQE